MMGKFRLLIVLFTILLGILTLIIVQCTNAENSITDSRGATYANPVTCLKCHKDVYKNYVHTSHYNTSAPLTNHQLHKDIVAGSKTFIFNDSLKVDVEKGANGLYQTAYFNNHKIRAERFDLVFGSGKRAQTYAYWRDNKLFQLPLSYFKEIHNWANSPGFPSQGVYYDRAIISRCFECHASNAQKKFVQNGSISVAQEYEKNTLIYGIDCQRCHGPAAQHVIYHEEKPDDKKAKYIVTYQSLTRQQKVDVCAVCHSGSDRELQTSTFNFKPGDDLSGFYVPFGQVSGTPDVHGNQANLLSGSKCYNNSAVMTCTTCHNTHVKEIANAVSYTQKCMTCHKTETHNFCKMAPKLGAAINNKCVDCHMPAMPSKLITYKATAARQVSSYYLHTHQIAVYPQKTEEIIHFINQNLNHSK